MTDSPTIKRASWAAGPPWRADRELDAARAERVVAAQFPELTPVQADYMGRGWDHDAYLINRQFVFRFPRREEVVGPHRREVALLQLLESTDLGVAIPRIEYVGEPDHEFPYPFSGYRLLPGVQADAVELPPSAYQRIAERYGRAVAALHAVPTDRFREVGVPVEASDPAEWLARTRDWADVIEQQGGLPTDVLDALQPLLHGDVEVPASFDGDPCLVHDDLGNGHVLIDPDTYEMTAIIDWADACISDPTNDLSPLLYWGPPSFFRDVIAHYGPISERQVACARFAGVVNPLLWFGETLAGQVVDDIETQRTRLIHRVRHDQLATAPLRPQVDSR